MINNFLSIRDLVVSRTAKDTSILFIGNGASAILGIIFTILAARFLGPGAWGIVAGVTSLIVILASIADLGLGSSIFRFLSKEWVKDKNSTQEIYKTIVFLRAASAILLSLFLILISRWFAPLIFQSTNSLLVVFTAIGVLGVLLVDLQIVTFQAKQNWGKAALFIAMTNILRLAFLLGLVLTGTVNLLTVLSAFVLSMLATWVISLVWQRVPLGIPNNWFVLSKKVFSFSKWMAGNQAVSAVNSRIDVLLLLNIVGSVNAGIYGAASRIALGFPLIVGSFATVLASRFASISQKHELFAFFKKSIGLSVLLASSLILGVLAAPVITLFLGKAYESSTQVLQWLLISFIPFTLSTPAVNILIYRFNKPYIITILSFVSLPIIVFGNIFLIPAIGILAPAFILAFTNTLTLAVTYFFVWREFKKLV